MCKSDAKCTGVKWVVTGQSCTLMSEPRSNLVNKKDEETDCYYKSNGFHTNDLVATERSGKWMQQFNIRGEHIINTKGLAVDVSGSRDKDGQNVIVWKKHNGRNQKWNIVYINEDSVQTGIIPDKPFRLVTKLRSGRVLTRTGNNVVIRSRNDKEDQIFVLDSKTKNIVPTTNKKLSLDIGDFGKNRYLDWMSNKDSQWHQHFTLTKEQLVNERGLALDVQGGRDKQN